MKLLVTVGTIVGLLCVPGLARAEEDPEDPRTRELFERGVELFATEEYEAALDAFQQAYELEPSGPVLYNIAMCQMALLRYVESIDTFNRYLELAGADVDDERRAEIDASIVEMEARLGEVRLSVEPPSDVEVIIDDESVPQEYWSRLRIRAGRHAIRVTAPRFLEETRQVDIPSGGVTEITIVLQPDPAFVERTPIVRRWWFWTIIGVVVVGTAVGLGVGLTSQGVELGQGDWDVRLP